MCLPNKAATEGSTQNPLWPPSRSLQKCKTLSSISTYKDVMKSVAYHSKYALLLIKLTKCESDKQIYPLQPFSYNSQSK